MRVALLISVMVPGAAFALNTSAEKLSDFTPAFGKARPPIGFVRFCAENPAECQKDQRQIKPLAMTPARWNQLYQVNTYVNGNIAPVSDLELYGEAERWAYPVDAGDCEDYLLLKKRYLENLGFPSRSLLITVVLDENQEGHAILTLVTDIGDFILDNRRNDITRWNNTNYTFLKRQSQVSPREWVALQSEKTIATGELSATAQN